MATGRFIILGICIHLIGAACARDSAVSSVVENHPDLSIRAGITYFGARPLTGMLVARRPDGKLLRETPYVEGKIHGIQRAWHANGELSSERVFVQGEKDGVHRGWHPDGSRRFVSRFRRGVPSGTYRTWHSNGRPHIEEVFDEKGGQASYKVWRPNGQIYSSYVIKNGRKYGLPGDKLCVSVKDGRGNDEATP